jgi:dephospho-CoA kinase
MIIGITGFFAAGKGEAADYLHTHHGFEKRGYGDVIRAEMKQMNIALGRDAEYSHANSQRNKHGFGYWSKKIVESIKPGENVVVEGIRNPGELVELSAADSFKLIAVTAPLELRFERMLSRKKLGDPTTLEELKAKEAREAHSDNPIEQSIADCVTKADYVVDNGDGWESFYQQLDNIVGEVTK